MALVNGLEEGIMAIAVGYLRPAAGSAPCLRSSFPQPAFEIFEFDASMVGARIVEVMPGHDFAFPLDDVLAAITRGHGWCS